MTTDLETFRSSALIAERLLVELGGPAPEHGGRLADFIRDTIEHQLLAQGAAPTGLSSDAGFSTQLEDQLYRARLIGASGLALCFGSLEAIADGRRSLSIEDSAALRAWFSAAAERPVQLYLPERATELLVFEAPRALASWLPGGRERSWAAIEYEPQPERHASGPCEIPPASTQTPPVEAFVVARCAEPEPTGDTLSEGEARGESAAQNEPRPQTPLPPPARAAADRIAADRAVADSAGLSRCQAWMQQLREMYGPKNHSTIERIFSSAYVPLSRELATGTAPDGAQAVVTEWAEGFAQSYSAAFKRMRGRRPRPRMVSDVLELATRWAGQYRARGCQLLLVDGMRFDLGSSVNEQLSLRLGQTARCVDQSLLWSALPSNTGAQLKMFAESNGLRPLPADKLTRPKPESARLTAEIERIELGARPIFRLDSVEEDLRRPGEPHGPRLERLAGTLACRIAPWIQTQPAATLVVLFGDHGFHWQSSGEGTTAAQCGGAFPEQVLVPASAWLVGDTRAAVTLH